ncbi:monovalent cation/H+ antiporter complex subunit F [Gammaproteobacteria bacterium]|jgi:multicomponent Na+:H+ antiporter subunit F|nr:pH regulation protein F [Pseudomonadota bacterium]MDB0064406.1 monovalent cation/H+ antiporter complex subunit F [Gammaproteobacteria bacterium]MDC1284894.1 monovalent cation/H+ antiporter complex subunit F [Gammaproteobacteria bacterium]
MIAAALVAIMIVMLIALIRTCIGPSLFDRILAINTFSTATVLMISLYGFFNQRPEFLDIAIVYAMINFIGTVALLKLHRFDDLGHDGDET